MIGLGFVLDNEAFSEIYKEFNGNHTNRISNINSLSEAVKKLIDSDDFKGSGAEALKSYFENVHGSIINSLRLLCTTHIGNFLKYKREYYGCIETDAYGYIKSSELDEIKNAIDNTKKSALEIDDGLAKALNKVNDIFYVKRQNISWVNYSHDKITKDITTLIDSVQQCENNHYDTDFVNTSDLITNLNVVINECLSKIREFKSNFNIESLSEITGWNKVYISTVNSYDEYKKNEEAYKLASDNVEKHVAVIKEDRERKASAIKWAVVGVTIIASVTVIALSGGTATPLVMGGLGALSGAANEFTNDLTDAYIENGNLFKYNNVNRVDWSEVGKDVTIAGVSGFASGYLGGSIAKNVGNIGSLKDMAGSASLSDRLISSALTKGGSKIIEGGMERGISSTIEETWDAVSGKNGFNGLNIVESVFDPVEISKDFGSGVISGSINEIVDTGVKKIHLDHYGLNNKSKIISGTTGFAIEGTKEATNGVAKRMYKGLVDIATGENITLSDVIDDAFDKNEILKDYLTEGANGATEQVAGNAINGDKVTLDDLKNEDIRSKIPTDVISEPEKWIKNGGNIYMDSKGEVTFEAREMKARNSLLSQPKDVLKYNNGKVDYDRSTVNNTQKVVGGHFSASTS